MVIAEAEDVHLFEPEVRRQRRHVIRGTLERGRRIAIRRPAVSLLFDRNHRAAAGDDRKHLAERDFDRGPTAVKEEQRHSTRRAVNLVVHADAIDRGVSAFTQRHDCPPDPAR